MASIPSTPLDLTPGAWCLLALSIYTIYFLISTIFSWHRLRHIPGPPLASLSYLWLMRTATSGAQYWLYRDLPSVYGPLIRVGPNELSSSDPEVIKRINGARNGYQRDPWYLAARFDPYHDNIFTILQAEKHDRLKAKIAGAYSGRETPRAEGIVDDQVKALVKLLRERYVSTPGKKRVVDLAEVTSYFTIDVITRAAFGEEFGCLRTNSDVYGFFESVKKAWAGIAVALDVPWTRNILFSDLYLRVFGPKPTDEAGLGKLMGIAEEIVAKRFAADAREEKDMLGSFIQHGLDRQECATEALFMIIAGFENTASVIRTTLLYLMSSPRVYQKFKAEIMQVVRNGKVSSPITVEEAKKIPYLQAIIYEGIRMRPPAPGLYPKAVPPQGDVISGYFIPGGTAIGMNTGALVRSKVLFGEDAEVFRPERFTEADDATRLEMERNVELVFGHGRWMCAGKVVAFMELSKIYFELFHAFDFQLVNPMKPWDSLSFSQFIEDNMWVQVTEAETA
ncbi:BcABA1, cytochrome P450 monooxygenase [Pseudomassariella vexata]|uniref:BcABA1, cytochrome P450 monooxygenase n=1 Tax=Pseudomassariella vexata TaxID=1141098 RepID=A0A1Y2EHS8_9PEZI|nr:BcABA1, cytochrome P450 monooxygenase [Pseudomassariella vexata]ORY70987.1 BcABA1, cytochrome P450 monooxygenase [Pseudomassariella vexata]